MSDDATKVTDQNLNVCVICGENASCPHWPRQREQYLLKRLEVLEGALAALTNKVDETPPQYVTRYERWQRLYEKVQGMQVQIDDLRGYLRLLGCPVGPNKIAMPVPEKKLARKQPCGCVVCTCQDATQCHGCRATRCGTPQCVFNVGNEYLQLFDPPPPTELEQMQAELKQWEKWYPFTLSCRMLTSYSDHDWRVRDKVYSHKRVDDCHAVLAAIQAVELERAEAARYGINRSCLGATWVISAEQNGAIIHPIWDQPTLLAALLELRKWEEKGGA